jgi:hypothetical protein
MVNDDGRTDRDRIDEVIDELLPAEVKHALDIAMPAEINRRRWFGVAMLVLAVFCMAVAAVPWPSRGLFDLVTWGVFSIVLLGVGAWQIDRASRDETEADRPMLDLSWDGPPEPAPDRKLRRVK